MRCAVDITVRAGKGYLPTLHKSEKHHLYVPREPVLVAELTPEGLAAAIRQKLAEGNPPIELPEDRAEFSKWWKEATRGKGKSSPVVKAAGVKSWKEFGQKARAYSIGWTDNRIIVDMSKPFERGGFLYDPKKAREFPPDTPLEQIVEVLLEDMRSIPELWEVETGPK